MRHVRVIVLPLLSCAAAPQAPVAHQPPAVEQSPGVAWSDVRAEIEASICLRAERVVGQIAAVYGDREACGLSPAETAVERAVARAFEAAKPALLTLREERAAALEALELDDPDAQLDGVRRAYMSDRFMAALLPRIVAALEDEGLGCHGCPRPRASERRVLEWDRFEPYLFAYVWPDPVVTARDDAGRETGKPKISVHICGGINGVAELADPDPGILRAAHLAALDTKVLHEAVPRALASLARSSAFAELTTDDERTLHLRRELAPTVLADPRVRPAVCETLSRFEIDTGVIVTDC